MPGSYNIDVLCENRQKIIL